MRQRFDYFVIRAGQAGPLLAERPCRTRKTVGLTERKLLGGTDGFMNVSVNAETDRIVGASIFGVGGNSFASERHVRARPLYNRLTCGTHSPNGL